MESEALQAAAQRVVMKMLQENKTDVAALQAAQGQLDAFRVQIAQDKKVNIHDVAIVRNSLPGPKNQQWAQREEMVERARGRLETSVTLALLAEVQNNRIGVPTDSPEFDAARRAVIKDLSFGDTAFTNVVNSDVQAWKTSKVAAAAKPTDSGLPANLVASPGKSSGGPRSPSATRAAR